jgi:hypothetical protein
MMIFSILRLLVEVQNRTLQRTWYAVSQSRRKNFIAIRRTMQGKCVRCG